MNTDGDDLVRKRKATARVVCIVAAVLVLIPCLGLKWIKSPKGSAGISLLFIGDAERSYSNLDFVDEINDGASDEKKILGTYAYAGIATLFFAIVAAAALVGAGALAFKDRFVRTPIPLTTVALLALSLSLITGCIFLGAVPQGVMHGGVSWPFFLYGTGIVAGIAGAQMLSKAYAEIRDPYWDGQV